MIGDMNRRIVIKTWGSTQDEGGGAIPALLSMWTLWAKVEARNGQLYQGQEQRQWTYDYKITLRYEKSRVIPSNATIDYDNKRLSINSISFSEEGNRKYCIVRCMTVDENIDTVNDVVSSIGTYDYYGIDHETEFTADGIEMTAPNTARDLRNKTIIGAFKDGVEFEVILGGTPDVTKKQVLYVPSSGRFLWSIPYEPGEHTLIQYI